MKSIKDISGQRFGKLVAIEYVPNMKYTYWLCICDCGTTKIVRAASLCSGHSKSCGCLLLSENRPKKHGHSRVGKRSKEYQSWQDIKKRCYDTNNKHYANYGGSGILMSDNFINNFEEFLAEIGTLPDDSYWSVDRIDNSKGYIEGNIRWANREQQHRNRSIRKKNKTGVNGVNFFVDKYGHEYYRATWCLRDGGVSISKNKTFSVNKYGKAGAFKLACDYRELQIKLLNEKGYGYSENHGKDPNNIMEQL